VPEGSVADVDIPAYLDDRFINELSFQRLGDDVGLIGRMGRCAGPRRRARPRMNALFRSMADEEVWPKSMD